MTLPSGSFPRTGEGEGSPTLLPTHTISGKEYPVTMLSDAEGHVRGSLPAWGFVVPPAAVGASKVYFDIFNSQASTVIRLRKLFAVIATDVAVAPTVGVRLDVMRTSAVGTGGTAFAGPASASKTASAFWPFTPGNTLPAGITGRLGPTGGATDQAWLFPTYIATEESQATTGTSSAASVLGQYFNLLPELVSEQPIELPTNFGLKVIQGSVASAGNVGFFGAFTVE